MSTASLRRYNSRASAPRSLLSTAGTSISLVFSIRYGASASTSLAFEGKWRYTVGTDTPASLATAGTERPATPRAIVRTSPLRIFRRVASVWSSRSGLSYERRRWRALTLVIWFISSLYGPYHRRPSRASAVRRGCDRWNRVDVSQRSQVWCWRQ